MKAAIILRLAKIIYTTGGRALLLKAIDDPVTEWDERVLEMCDALFGYSDGS